MHLSKQVSLNSDTKICKTESFHGHIIGHIYSLSWKCTMDINEHYYNKALRSLLQTNSITVLLNVS